MAFKSRTMPYEVRMVEVDGTIYGCVPDLIPLDNIYLWIHEFSEGTIKKVIGKRCSSLRLEKWNCSIPHFLVSLHTISVVNFRGGDENNYREDMVIYTPNIFSILVGKEEL